MRCRGANAFTNYRTCTHCTYFWFLQQSENALCDTVGLCYPSSFPSTELEPGQVDKHRLHPPRLFPGSH